MKFCFQCGNQIDDNDLYCTVCGAKQDAGVKVAAGDDKGLGPIAPDNVVQSTIMKYSGYLNNEALFKVAWAKEKGLVKSDDPNEAEYIYQMLALRGHNESMYRYAMILLSKVPPEKAEAEKWLRIAARQGHIPSRNYLEVIQTSATAGPFMSDFGRHKGVPTDAPVDHAPSQDGLLSGEQVYLRMNDYVVEIAATDDGEAIAQSSGFMISSNGFVMTNAHAILNDKGQPFRTIKVRQNGEEYDAAPIAAGAPFNGRDPSIDIALLFVKGLKRSGAVAFGDSNGCTNGQKVYLFGNSLGAGTCITSGIISDAKREISGLPFPYIMTDAAANHGNSGGPLVNERGEVIGVLVAGIEHAEGMNFAIPSDVAKAFVAYVLMQARFPQDRCGELGSMMHDAKPLSNKWDKILSGVKLLIEGVLFALSIL